MTNIVSINCTSDYLVKRASRHRHAGRYDEAMALLWKARNQFPQDSHVLMEMANVYDEIGCEEDAVRVYLRLVRLGGAHKATALFRLTLASAQHGDMQRALSYYDHLRQMQDQTEIAPELMDELLLQLKQDIGHLRSFNRKRRAKALEKRAAQFLQLGKAVAAQRAMEHALRMRPTAQGYTMLACCQLIRSKPEDAVISAKTAHRMCPGDVQTLCVLADAYMACGDKKKSRSMIYLAAIRAHQPDDLLSVAVESAKAGEDALTLQTTRRILKVSPYHTRAMMICACVHINQKAFDAAKRLLGRLCGIIPENSICESYYRMLCDDKPFLEHLSLGIDVTREEGIHRAAELVSLLYQDPKAIDDDPGLCSKVCRLCDWAFHSPMAGSSAKTVALVLLASLQSERARDVLLDLLMDPQIADSLKLHVLQVLTSKEGFHPYHVDMGGKLMRLAAGSVSNTPVQASQANSRIVQRVADVLEPHDPNATPVLLEAYLAYLDAFGKPDSKHEDVCAAALELWYRLHINRATCADAMAARYGVSIRIMRLYLRRFESCTLNRIQPIQEEKI